MNRTPKQFKKKATQRGFTMIEAVISILVLSFGVLALAAVYAQGMYFASLSQYDYVAEKKAEQAVEAIFTARDNNTLKLVADPERGRRRCISNRSSTDVATWPGRLGRYHRRLWRRG